MKKSIIIFSLLAMISCGDSSTIVNISGDVTRLDSVVTDSGLYYKISMNNIPFWYLKGDCKVKNH